MTKLDLSEDDFRARFLQNITMRAFMNDYFRKSIYLVRANYADYYSNIFTKDDFAEIFEHQLLHRPSVRMIGEGRVLPMQDISMDIPFGKFTFENVVDVAKVREWYGKGYTINVRGAHFFHSGLQRCTAILSSIFGCNVRANVYLTPGRQTGLSPHYDVNDVLVMQIKGEKRWSFYRNNFEAPTEEFRIGKDSEFVVGDVESQIILAPGDTLYVPRGVSHSATALSESLHVTIGIEEPTLSDVVRELVNILAKRPSLRGAVDCRQLLADSAYMKGITDLIGDTIRQALVCHDFEAAVIEAQRKNLNRSVPRDASFLRGGDSGDAGGS